MAIRVAAGEILHFAIDPQTGQKIRLRGEARELESGGPTGLGERREVDPGGDVLQTRMHKGIAMRAMAEMAQQRAVAPLRKILLRSRQAIIEP